MKAATPVVIAAILTASLGAGASVTGAADPARQFRTATELVPVYTTVKDRQGRLVPDLRKEDFVVTDNGKEQPISVFSNEVTPFTAIVMLDRSQSMSEHRRVIARAAAAFVTEMSSGDKARIGHFGYRIQIEPAQFTSDKDDLYAVIRQQPGDAGASPVWLSVDKSITALYGLPGRRVVLLMSDGHDHPAGNQPETSFKDVADRVRRADVMVYAIGFASSRGPGGEEKPDERLRTLADISGGGYFEMTDPSEMTQHFTRVAEELHHQYWIGFEPPKRDGKVHEIKVKVKQSGMNARARQSYVAPAK
jgi:Ca-activated chloride channel family protein